MNNFNKTGNSQNGQAYTNVCLNCRHENLPGSIFCTACGKPLNVGAAPQNQNQGQMPNFGFLGVPSFVFGIPIADWCSYIGKGWQAYLPKFAKMEAGGAKISISLSAFFLGPVFFAYRKLFWQAAVCLLLFLIDFVPATLTILAQAGSPLLAGINQNVLGNVIDAVSLGILALRICMALFANYWYKQKSLADISAIKSRTPLGQSSSFQLGQKGGTSIAAVFVVVGILMFASYFVSAAFSSEILAFYQLNTPQI